MNVFSTQLSRIPQRYLMWYLTGAIALIGLLILLILSKTVWYIPHGMTRTAAEISPEQLHAVELFEEDLNQHLQKLNAIGLVPVSGWHGPLHGEESEQSVLREASHRQAKYHTEIIAIEAITLPTVDDNDGRWYIASARMSLLHYANMLRTDAASLTPQTVDTLSASYYYPFERNHKALIDARSTFSENSLRVYRNYGYDLNDIDNDNNRLKRDARPKKKTTFDRD